MNKEVLLRIEHFSRGQDVEFRIKSKKEMQFILQDIAEKGSRVALYYDGTQHFILTTLYGANADGMWLDISPSPQENKRILLSEKITFVSMHQHVKVQFEAQDIVEALLEGDKTFYLDLPEYLLRIQRRDHFRLRIPASTPFKCFVPVKPFDPNKPGEPEIIRDLPVMDISTGGIGLLCGEYEAGLQPKATFQNCRISLPDIGTIRVNIEVKNNVKFSAPNGATRTRIGCQFLRMDNQASLLLQSYVNRLQSESLAKDPSKDP